jgi:hypothetical protein
MGLHETKDVHMIDVGRGMLSRTVWKDHSTSSKLTEKEGSCIVAWTNAPENQ